jgi:phenylacetate-CoA ligase
VNRVALPSALWDQGEQKPHLTTRSRMQKSPLLMNRVPDEMAEGEALRQLQLAKLQRLVATVRRSNRFYVRKLAPLGPEFHPRSLEDFVQRFPLTRKHELMNDQLAHPPYGTNLTHPLDHYTRCHQTSGSTGEPLRWLDTPESWQHLLDNWREIFRAAAVSVSDRFLLAFSFGPFIGFWSAMESALQLGCFCFPGGSMTSEARLKTIADHHITVLCCTPTYALHLGELAVKAGLAAARSSLRLIIVAGEPGGSIPATRARLAQCWPQARLFDHYGMTEVGPVTYECPAEPGLLHVIESTCLAEVIDPHTTQPVRPGQTGELVLTTLDRLGSPVLRYRTGDLVKPRPSGLCACGRFELALEGGILGRCDDMVVVRGVNVFPSAVEEIVRGCGGVTEYRVLVESHASLLELRLEIEPAPDCSNPAEVARRLQKALQDAFSLRVPVQVVPAGHLPRFEMKARRWVRVAL